MVSYVILISISCFNTKYTLLNLLLTKIFYNIPQTLMPCHNSCWLPRFFYHTAFYPPGQAVRGNICKTAKFP